MLIAQAIALAQSALALYLPQLAPVLHQISGTPSHPLALDHHRSENPDRPSFVFRADCAEAGNLVIKVAPPAQIAPLAARLFATHPVMAEGRFRVPKPVFYDPQLGALIMEDTRGQPAANLWLHGGAQAERALAAAGGWLARYHALSVNPAAFNPDPHLNWLRKSIAAHHAGHHQIADFADLIALLGDLERLAETARGQPCLRAITHRDFHLHNLMVRNLGRTFGIDMENAARDVAMRDLLSCLADTAKLQQDKPSEANLRTTARAVRKAYGRAPASPAPQLFFQRIFGMMGWAGIDIANSAPGAKRARHLDVMQLLACAPDLFALKSDL